MLKVGQNSFLAIVMWLVFPIKLVQTETIDFSQSKFSCPGDVKMLATLMLKDLPNYSNRVIQRSQKLTRKADIRRYIITAATAEFEPLELPRIRYSPIDLEKPEQLFFTVVEKQYQYQKATTIQTYHWLFLTQTKTGWQEVMMFSRFGTSQSETVPTPPRESSNGIIGQGVKLWLRDCRAGTVRLSHN